MADTFLRATANLFRLLEVSFLSAYIRCIFDFRSLTLDMASTRKKGGYKAVDPVDVFLLNQVVKHVDPEELDSMARDLFVDETVYQGIQNPQNRVYKVMN